MTDYQPVCVECSLQRGLVTRLRIVKTGVAIPYGAFRVQVGDLYECPFCGRRIVKDFGEHTTGERDPLFRGVEDRLLT